MFKEIKPAIKLQIRNFQFYSFCLNIVKINYDFTGMNAKKKKKMKLTDYYV